MLVGGGEAVVQRVVEAVGCAGAVWVGVRDDLFYGVWGELIVLRWLRDLRLSSRFLRCAAHDETAGRNTILR